MHSAPGRHLLLTVAFLGGCAIAQAANSPPTISSVRDQVMLMNSASASEERFSVGDAETPASSLVVRADSSNTNLVPPQKIVLGAYSGDFRYVRVTPASNQLGVATITLTVSDGSGGSASTSFVVTVRSDRPVISSSVYSQLVPLNASTTLTFRLTDRETPASNLLVSAYSTNVTVLPDEHISLGGSGSNRTVTVFPAADQMGITAVVLTVQDEHGVTNITSLVLNFSLFAPRDVGFSSGDASTVGWGDFDDDHWLDVCIAGSNPTWSPGVTRLYRNGPSGFESLPAVLVGIRQGSFSWMDVDNDGRLELLVTGAASNAPVTKLYRISSAGVATELESGLPAIDGRGAAWGDYNNDGLTDVLLAGETTTSGANRLTKLYRNVGNGRFVDSGVALPVVTAGTASWVDFDRDGDLDLTLLGTDADYRTFTRIYRNAGNSRFVDAFVPVANLSGGSADWGDFDNDADLDLLLTGYDSGYHRTSFLYRQEADGRFTQVPGSLPGSDDQTAGWGDFDNDGDLDFLLTGGWGPIGRLYQNDGAGNFSFLDAWLPSLADSASAWADYDLDGDLDFVLSGSSYDWGVYTFVTSIFENHSARSNTPPTPPTGLASTVSGTAASLSWRTGWDAEQGTALTYNLRVGTTPGGVDILTPLSDVLSGTRKVTARGNVDLSTIWILKSLRPATYYWAVQSIDHGYAASEFSEEAVFTVTGVPGAPDAFTEAAMDVILDQATLHGLSNPNGLAATCWFQYGTSTNDEAATPALAIGPGTQEIAVEFRLRSLQAATTYQYRVVASNSAGVRLGAYRTFTTPEWSRFSEMPFALPGVAYGVATFGDADNDDDLDVFVSGPMDWNFQFISRLLRSDSGTNFTELGNLPEGALRGCDPWSDFDGDGDLDLMLGSGIGRNNGSGGFALFPLSIGPERSRGAQHWVDVDNDGDEDILISGTLEYPQTYQYLLRNDRSGRFTQLSANLPWFASRGTPWADYDNDGDMDCFYGLESTGSNEVALISENLGGGLFRWTNSWSASRPEIAVCADFDSDGDQDLLVPRSFGTSDLFHNDGPAGFSESGFALPSNETAALLWGDFDNDHDLDLVTGSNLAVENPASTGLRLYRNVDGNLIPADLIPGLDVTSLACGDYDNDGDLDLLLTGLRQLRRITRILRNNEGVRGVLPGPPHALTAWVSGNGAQLSWRAPADFGGGVSYNVRVGTTSGGSQWLSPLANAQTGFRRVARFGNAQLSTSWRLTNLYVGSYYWSVQAVSHSYAGGPFAPEAVLIVPPHEPEILSSTVSNLTFVQATVHTLVNANAGATTLFYQYGTASNSYRFSTPGQPLGSGITPVAATTVLEGLQPNVTYYARAVASNEFGVAYGFPISFTTPQFTEVTAALPTTIWGTAVWGDYDRDGDLDLAFSGVRSNQYLTGIYRNDGGDTFTAVSAGLPQSYVRSMTWADFDRDGNLDLLHGSYTIFRNQGNGTFVVGHTFQPAFFDGDAAVGDLDNDGDLDVLLSGERTNTLRTRVFLNNGFGNFSESAVTNLAGLEYSVASLADFDEDGDLDIFLAGSTSFNSALYVYRNDRACRFRLLDAAVLDMIPKGFAWGDYDNDNDLDLLANGFDQALGLYVTRLYRNDGGGFAAVEGQFQGASGGRPAWGDYDNDGWLDALVGFQSGTRLFRNLGGVSFTNTAIAFSGLAAFGDYDQDGDLDLFSGGEYVLTRIFRNNNVVPNTSPSAPTGLTATVVLGDAVQLGWLGGGDAEGGWSFNLRLGTTPGAGNIVPPMVCTTTCPAGRRLLPGLGNAAQTAGWAVTNLAPGTYYWSVQTVDHGYAASAFAQERSFVILPGQRPPTVASLATTNVSFFEATVYGWANPNGVSTSVYFEYGTNQAFDLRTAVQDISSGNSPVQLSPRLTGLMPGTTYSYRLVGTNRNGVAVGDELRFSTPAYVAFSRVVSPAHFWNSSAAWGDYDNDEDLDLLLCGSVLNSQSTSLYQYETNGLRRVVTSIIDVDQGSVAWGDYDKDGDLDVLIGGLSRNNGWLTRVYRNDGAGQFVDIQAGLPGPGDHRAAWADFDGDGLLDIAITGYASGTVYRNLGNGTFRAVPVGLLGVTYGSMSVADSDADGDPDILISGFLGQFSGYGTALYRNDGSFVFTEVATPFPRVAVGSSAWGDYDNDGDLDVLINGTTNTSAAYGIARLFRNQRNNGFTEVPANCPAVTDGTYAWGDFNSDGWLDLAAAGDGVNYNPFAALLAGDGNGNFTNVNSGLSGADEGIVTWADFDQDGKLDLAITGFGTWLYRNNEPRTNTLPSSPSGLSSSVWADSVVLRWNPPSDANQTSGFSYAVRVGTGRERGDILNPMANPVTGFRRVAQLGNVYQQTSVRLTNLVSGVYYWSVQAVDHSYAGSRFVPEQTFVIGPQAPSVQTLQASNVAAQTAQLNGVLNPNGAGTEYFFQFGLTTNYGDATPVRTLLGTNNFVVTAVIDELLAGTTYHFRLVASNLYGVRRGLDESFTPPLLAALPAAIVNVRDGSVAWGDYDRDGDLDLLVTGQSPDVANSLVSRVYRNDGGDNFTDLNAGLPGVWFSAAWGDPDKDNDLDLLISGGTTRIFRNDGDDRFADSGLRFPGVAFSSLAWGDYDNDGDLDFGIAGDATTRLYRNDYPSEFSDSGVTIQGVSSSAFAWGDYDNDGDLDLVRSGMNTGGVRDTRIFRNASASFSTAVTLTGVRSGSLAWGDYDNDGDLDLLITGEASTSSITRIYRNDGNNVFSIAAASFPGVSHGDAVWGDFNNDGLLDVLLSGYTGANQVTKLYRQQPGEVFAEVPTVLPILSESAIAVGDYDADGDLDVALCGLNAASQRYTRIFRNDLSAKNPAPAPPATGDVVVTGSVAAFIWSPASDSNQPGGHSYQLRVGTAPGKGDILSPMALADGRRLLPVLGNANTRPEWTLRNLAVGKYFWSVQAVDHGYAGSVFSADRSFVVPPAATGAPLIYAVGLTHAHDLELQIIGYPSQTYQLQASLDLLSWTPIETITMPASGETSLTVSSASATHAFFRLRFGQD